MKCWANKNSSEERALRVPHFNTSKGLVELAPPRSSGRWREFFLQTTELVFQLSHPVIQTLQSFARFNGNKHAVLAVVTRGSAALDGIFKFLAAGAAGALTFSRSHFFQNFYLCRFSRSITALVTPPSMSRRRSRERVSPMAVTRMAASSVTGHSCSQMPQPMHSAGSM